MKNFRLFSAAKKKALSIMRQVHDPFHEAKHVLDVEKTAMKIYKALDPQTKKKADPEIIRLAALFHDTSRKFIKTNLILQQLFDGYLSGKIAYKTLISLKYPKKKALEVKNVIIDHELLVKLVRKKPSLNCKIITDADWIESFSPKRLENALPYFESKKFPPRLLNLYTLGMTLIHNKIENQYYFPVSKKIQKEYLKKLILYLLKNKSYLKEMLYPFTWKKIYRLRYLHQ